MRYISISHVKENDIAAMNISDANGTLLVAHGAVLTKTLISRLKNLGFQGIYIGDSISEDIEIPEKISAELRGLAKECIRSVNVKDSLTISRALIEEMMEKQIVSLDMQDVRPFDDFTYAHTINVAVISCVIGIAMKLNSKDLFDLVNAAVLHDFGKLKVPEAIINKAERLTGAEYEEVKRHVSYSCEMIENNEEISEETKAAVRAHHENEDGSGYPNGLTSEEIPLIAKILHVADVYDALVSNRPYKAGYAPWEAVEYLMGGCGIIFDKEVVDNFVKVVPIYPIGTEVRLSNGEIGVVIANKGNNNLRPVVRIIRTGANLDLAQRENMSIAIFSSESTFLQKNEEDRNEMVEASVHRRIIIVDDMKTNLQMLREILEPQYKVIPFKSGGQLLKYLESHNEPDLIILDIDMPLMSGTEAAQKVNEMYNSRIPLLFVTTLTDKKTVLTCRELGASGYIVRPYQPVYILSEVKRILDGCLTY